jgi:hypothetical protein
MRSKVFVSCGQHTEEKAVASKVGQLLRERGFDVYVAIDVQTILEINADIIRELKNSDCYLFVNFRREQVGERFDRRTGERVKEYRGSLFSNQELAIAYAMGFERILVVNQEGTVPEGMLRYIAINTETFASLDDCSAAVGRALDRSGWAADYSRRLSADRLHFADALISYGNLLGRFLYVDLLNNRPDIAALGATARLSEFGAAGQALKPSPIRSPLKATGRPGFSHTIFPRSHEAFDLLCVGTCGQDRSPGILLNTALDVAAPPRLPITLGVWHLRYEFFAIDFPLLSVLVELTLTNWNQPSAKLVVQEVP